MNHELTRVPTSVGPASEAHYAWPGSLDRGASSSAGQVPQRDVRPLAESCVSCELAAKNAILVGRAFHRWLREGPRSGTLNVDIRTTPPATPAC